MRHADFLRRYKCAALGVAGLASVLGAGACQAAGPVADKTPSPAATTAEQQIGKAEGIPQGLPAPARPQGLAASGPAAPKSTSERLSEARGANERLGTMVRRPREKPVSAADPSKVRRVEKGSVQKDKRMMRIVSSKQDLSGYGELAWVADEGEPYGKADCSRMIQMSEAPPKEKPTLLICWRLTPKKSVYAIAVNLKQNPTARDTVAALEKEWARMG
jgi:hypothetical protein